LVEAARHPALKAVEAATLGASFLEKFIHSHQIMFASNSKMGKKGRYGVYLSTAKNIFDDKNMFSAREESFPGPIKRTASRYSIRGSEG
jgi:hypothetical protein